MKINFSETFLKKLYQQIDYIAEDKPQAAKKFRVEIFKEIKKISKMPYQYRKSIYSENEDNVRDLIYKGYIIIFKISTDKNVIEILEFIKYLERP